MSATNHFPTENFPQVFASTPPLAPVEAAPREHSAFSPSEEPSPAPSLFPAFLKLHGRSVLVVGAGKVGEQKIEALLSTGARITVIAREASPAVQAWARAGKLSVRQRAFQPADLEAVFLVIVATQSRQLNEFIYREAHLRNVLCNVVDVPDLCDFFYPAVVRRGHLQIAVSTSGQSPSLAQRIRNQVEQQFGPNYSQWVEELGRTRQLILGSELPHETKQDLLHSLASREAFEAALDKLRAARHTRQADGIKPDVQDSQLATSNSEFVARSPQLEARSSLAARSSAETAEAL